MTQTIQVSVQGIYTCTVTDLNGCVGEGTVKSKIWPTGVEEVLAADGWMVYPNPASNFIQIRFANASNQSRQIDLIDLKGALVRSWSFDIHTSERQFDISNLPAGSYTLRALGDQSVNELPLLIQR